MQYPFLRFPISILKKRVQNLPVGILLLSLLCNVILAVPLTDTKGLLNFSQLTESGNLNKTGLKIDPLFNPVVETAFGLSRAVLLQSDGKVLIAGNFKSFNGIRRNGIIRLNPDQSLDLGFDANIDGLVYSLAQQSDGKILVGVAFSAVGGAGVNQITRLNSDGSVDETFASGEVVNGIVSDIVVQSDGKILIGGNFTGINSVFRNCIARLNADGSIDTSFTSPFPPVPPPGPTSQFSVPSNIYSFAIQPDGNILVGGFLVINYDAQIIYSIARLSPNGSYETTFNPPQMNSEVTKLALQPDGNVLISGFFTNINGVERRYLARLNSSGSLDASFDATGQAVAPVYSLYLRNDGKVLFGSIITPTGAVMKQLNANGSLDVAFTTNDLIPGVTYAITPLTSGKILAAGSISAVSGGVPNTVLIFNADGTQDESFEANFRSKGRVRAIAVQKDGKILIGGLFNRVNGFTSRPLRRLNTNGTIDDDFSADFLFATRISVIAIQPDGKILVGGSSLSTGSGPGKTMLRLNSDGTLDSTFTPVESGSAKTITVQSDGKILMSYQTGTQNGQETGGLRRYNADGALDPTFQAALNRPYDTIVVLGNGQIIAGGEFSFGYVSPPAPTEFHRGVVRLNADGSHDRTFLSGLVAEIGRFSSVKKILIQDDGKLLVGGSLYTGALTTPVAVVRLNSNGTVDGAYQQNAINSGYQTPRVEDMSLLENGNLIVGGLFNSFGGVAHGNIALLSPDGAVDSAFNVDSDSTVFETEIQNDGGILLGGDFDLLNDLERTAIGRLVGSPLTANIAPFDFDGDGKTDVAIFRPVGGGGSSEWWWVNSANSSNSALQFGTATDVIAPGDFTGDGKMDITIFRPSTGTWFVLRSDDFSFFSFPFGSPGDTPATGDYDGDGKADPAVFRESVGQWFIQRSSDNQVQIVQFGIPGDVPVTADYDGDGKDDIGIYRRNGANGGEWWINRSTAGLIALIFGTSTDLTVPGDYTGDGKADIAFFRPSNGTWFVLRSEDLSFFSFPFGATGDVPSPGDYDGDGRIDAAVFRPSSATWFIQGSTSGTTIQQFGSTGDVPVPSSFVR